MYVVIYLYLFSVGSVGSVVDFYLKLELKA
jgi:hypothetical protein